MSPRADRTPAPFDEADRGLRDVLAALEGAEHYTDWLWSLVRPHLRGRVLEVGAGRGTFSHRLVEVAPLVAVEPSAAQVAVLRECIEPLGATVIQGVLDDVGGAPYGTIVMLNVLEHIPDDDAALATCQRLLEPGGTLVLWVPAFESLYGRFDHRIGHYRRYRRADLTARCARAGLRVEQCRYANLPGFFAWWLIVRLLRRVPTAGGLAGLYDRFVVPVARRVEARLPVPFGQSLFLVATRPRS